jgi:hypothetical protein
MTHEERSETSRRNWADPKTCQRINVPVTALSLIPKYRNAKAKATVGHRPIPKTKCAGAKVFAAVRRVLKNASGPAKPAVVFGRIRKCTSTKGRKHGNNGLTPKYASAGSMAFATVRDPAMLLVAFGVLFATTALACLYPAWRAASIDPMRAIRTESHRAQEIGRMLDALYPGSNCAGARRSRTL